MVNRKWRIALLLPVFLTGWQGYSQSAPQELALVTLDYPSLLARKKALDSGNKAFQELIEKADQLLAVTPEKVTDGDVPPSGDVHDFYAIGKLSWRNPDTPDGLPYSRRDGLTNPEADGDRYDLGRYNRTISRINLLALAWFYSGDEKYAGKATELLRVWFLNKESRMNPTLKNASALPGVYDGMPVGIIFGVVLIKMVDHVKLLTHSSSWTQQDNEALKGWFAAYRDWLLESNLGKKEGAATNNHGSWYGAQVAAFSIYNDRPDQVAPVIARAREQLDEQVAADGSMPRETARQRSLHYSVYGLQAFTCLARCAELTGSDLWGYRSDDGRGLELAFRFLEPFVTGSREWPWKDIDKGKPPGAGVRDIFDRAAAAYPEKGFDKTVVQLRKDLPEDAVERLIRQQNNTEH